MPGGTCGHRRRPETDQLGPDFLGAEDLARLEEPGQLDLRIRHAVRGWTTLRIISVPKSPRIVPLAALRESVGPRRSLTRLTTDWP